MPIKYISYIPNTIKGQAILNNFVRTSRILKYRDNDKVYERIKRGLPLYEVEKIESVGNNPNNLVIRGECLSACAYLKDKDIKVDLVYIDPPFASGADYAKKVYIRKNPKLVEKIAKAEEEFNIEEMQSFEEKMYGDIWNKEDYLNWMFENLTAIKSIMSEKGSIYVHLDWHIGHYVKILMDEIFGEDNFVNEIIWSYTGNSVPAKCFQKKHDTIFIYSKTEEFILNLEDVLLPYSENTLKRYNHKDEDGKKYKISSLVKGNKEIVYAKEGKIPDSVWEIPIVRQIDEKVDYATQKPEALLQRIIKASSNETMIVADFFGGSGVTAKVANVLKRNFIHVDVGINSIQTVRDRLKESKAGFDILDIKDGVSLFRNPIQTMEKLKSLITGLKKDESIDNKFWFGAITDSKLGLIPVYVPDLLDHNAKVLDIPVINKIINEAISELPDNIKQVIVYYIDIDDETKLLTFIKDYNNTQIKIILKDLKEILDEVIINDEVIYNISEANNTYIIEIEKFISDRLIQKISEYNKKRTLNSLNKETDETEYVEENLDNPSKSKKIKQIEISDDGLELIEMISFDCFNKEGIWNSDFEIKIDKKGFMVKNGLKTKEFWDGKIYLKNKPYRMKVRNIAGDETIIIIENKI